MKVSKLVAPLLNINLTFRIQPNLKSLDTSEGGKGRRRKTADEINLLEQCFANDNEWTRETVEFLKSNTHLSYTQIYKWGWDQKKKVEKNPRAKRIPTIDEFGGYCKFDSAQVTPITKVLDVDWNEKIRVLLQDIDNEDNRGSEPKENAYKRVKTGDSPSEESVVEKKPLIMTKIEIPDDESNSTPPVKAKRQRYASDLTNATRKASVEPKVVNNPYVEDEFNFDPSFEYFQEDAFNFEPNSFKLGHIKVRQIHELLLTLFIQVDTHFDFKEKAEDSPRVHSFDLDCDYDFFKLQWE